jgi:hypothetical protein
VIQVEAGVDPKSMFCQFFKQGLCKKGDKCKFSHDPDVERKAVKRNVYEEKVIGVQHEIMRYVWAGHFTSTCAVFLAD